MSSSKPSEEQAQELADIQELFHFYDTKGDGHVCVDQLGHCLRSMGLCPSQAQLAQLTAQQGSEEGRRISVEQFIPMLAHVRKLGALDRSEAELTAFLEIQDRDGSGTVGMADLRHLLTRFGEPLDEEEFEKLVATLACKEGRLNIAELVQTLTATK